jgi:hypothetical protein
MYLLHRKTSRTGRSTMRKTGSGSKATKDTMCITSSFLVLRASINTLNDYTPISEFTGARSS